jgi:excisionase family DNA binding protein
MVSRLMIRTTYCEGLRILQVVERLGLSEEAVRDLIASGGLPAVRLGRATRVPLAAVQRYIEKRGESRC